MKSCLFFFLLSFLCFGLSAQTVIKTFFDKEHVEANPENCYYYRVTKPHYHPVDSIVEFYCTSNLRKSVTFVNEYGFKNGTYMSFYESGRMELKGKFEVYSETGLFTRWYANGQKQAEAYFGNEDEPVQIVNFWDSLGNQLVVKGNGLCSGKLDIIHDPELQEGMIVNGLKESTWVGYRKDAAKYFEEEYMNGKLISGTSYDSMGVKYSYKEISESAAPIGGMTEFYSMVGKNVKYPVEAKRKGVQGKVFVEFVIEKDGSLSNVKAIKGPDRSINLEAEKVIKLSPKWKPGLQRGQVVNQKMVLPINFRLG